MEGTRLDCIKQRGGGAGGWSEDSFPSGGDSICKGQEVGPCCTCESMLLFLSREEGLEKGALGPRAGLLMSPQLALLLPFQNDNHSSLLNNYVLGAQLGHGHVNNLKEPINISFWHNQSLVLWGRPHFHPILSL